jgi:serine protease Do
LLAVSAAPFSIRAQEAPPDSAAERARDAFRDAIERLWVPQSRLATGPHVLAAFRDVVASVNQSTVVVRCNGKDEALGGIVGSDGWVLTKATELSDPITCRLPDGRELEAELVGVDREFDLAMLKVPAKKLPALDLSQNAKVEVGAWLATAGVEKDPTAVGIVSVTPRRIAHQPGILGVRLEEVEKGPLVAQVFDESGAARAGVLVNDIVLSVSGQQTPNREKLIEQIRRYSPGDEVELKILRGEEEITLRATLVADLKDFGPLNRSEFQNAMGGELSGRRFGFPNALQHDTVLQPEDCGGPVVDLDGRVVGFNIARSGRTESYAIPTSAIAERIFDLMSGKLAPREEEIKVETQQPSSEKN